MRSLDRVQRAIGWQSGQRGQPYGIVIWPHLAIALEVRKVVNDILPSSRGRLSVWTHCFQEIEEHVVVVLGRSPRVSIRRTSQLPDDTGEIAELAIAVVGEFRRVPSSHKSAGYAVVTSITPSR